MTLPNSSTDHTQAKYDVSTADVLKCPLGVAIWNDRIKPPSALLAFITVLWMWGPKVSLVSRVTPKSRIEFTCSKAEYRKPVTGFIKCAYHGYFGIKLGDQDKAWAPHMVCKTRTETLRGWTNDEESELCLISQYHKIER